MGATAGRKILFLEPFYGGSHKEFAKGLITHSRHTIDLLTLPPSFWKWRMRGAALHFIRKIRGLETYEGLITTDLMSLSDFKSLAGGDCPPALVYFHENQFSYPLAPGEQMDYQFGFTDITTALAAERILFNSQYHLDAFVQGTARFLKMMPDHQPRWVTDVIRAKAGVLYPGCRLASAFDQEANPNGNGPPLIVWNHRWEFDKNPDDFFQALEQVAATGRSFRLALLGERNKSIPEAFERMRNRFNDRIVQFGYAASRQEYIDWLKAGDIVVSTAIQENFGIAVVEAIGHGCVPLLPERLSYPEIIPKAFHGKVLYKNQTELANKLAGFIDTADDLHALRRALSAAMMQYSWDHLIQQYDEEIETLCDRAYRCPPSSGPV